MGCKAEKNVFNVNLAAYLFLRQIVIQLLPKTLKTTPGSHLNNSAMGGSAQLVFFTQIYLGVYIQHTKNKRRHPSIFTHEMPSSKVFTFLCKNIPFLGPHIAVEEASLDDTCHQSCLCGKIRPFFYP